MYDNHIAVHPLRRARRAAQIRDIRVGAFDVLNVVSGTAGCSTFSQLHSNPILGSPVIDKGG
jgi:hypothetical protein